MANKTFWFPNQSGSAYTLPTGKSLRVKIFYSNATTVDVDTDTEIHKWPDIDFPFEISDNGRFRLSKTTLTFLNIDDVFETEEIIKSGKESETFISIIVDGSELWRGIVQHDLYTQTEWYKTSALKYNLATIVAFDALHYFWLNSTTLSDVSYSDAMTFQSLMENIIAELGFSASALSMDTKTMVTEACGNTYGLADFYLADFGANMLVRTFLLHVMLDLACFMYTLDGKVYITSRVAGTTQAISDDDILDVNKISNKDYVDYISISATKDWSDLVGAITGNVHQYTSGTQASNSKDYEVDGSDFLDRIYTRMTSGNTYFGGCGIATPTGGDTLNLQDEIENYYTEEIETGMVAEYNCVGSPVDFSVIQDVIYSAAGPDNRVVFIAATAVDIGKDYRLWRKPNPGSWATERLFKIELLCEQAKDVYAEYFKTEITLLDLKLYQIDTYKTFYKRFVFASENYRMRNMKLNLIDDTVETTLAKVT